MLKRLIQNNLRQDLKNYPAVALVGPRQCGKTTLARTLSKTYFDLEQAVDRARFAASWQQLSDAKSLLILDEAQSYPEIFPLLRGAIDNRRKRNGRFLLLGSVAPALMRNVSESLAGRLALRELTPLLLKERGVKANPEELWFLGGYPDGGILKKRRYPAWQKNYLSILAQRDLPLWGLPAKPQLTQRFFKMLAANHAQTWNASQIGRGLGLDYHTVQTYLEYLINAYLIRLLPPFHANLNKRLVKSPKLYWRDSGVLHALLDVESYDELMVKPWIGFSWEGWVIEQIISHLQAWDILHTASYFRTNDGFEADLVLEIKGQIWVFEIKRTSILDDRDLDRLKTVATLLKAHKRFLIARTKQTIVSDSLHVMDLPSFLTFIRPFQR